MEININLKKVFLITLIISLSLSAILGIIIFLIGDFGEIQIKALLTTLTIGGFSLTGLCCATLLGRKRFSPFAILGIILSIWGFLFIISLIWSIVDWSSSSWKVMIVSIILAFSTAHASLLLIIKSDKAIVKASLAITILFVFLVALELIILTLYNFSFTNSMLYRLLGVFAILDVLGTIVTPIILKVTSLHNQ